MQKAKNSILYTIILLIFAGQAIASSVISCSMTMMQSSQSDMKMMNGEDHSNHNMSQLNDGVEAPTSMQMDCCGEEGNCTMAGCLLIIITDTLQIPSSQLVQQAINFQYSMTPRKYTTSLFRPPILS